MTRSGIGIAGVLVLLLAACTVGPKYKAPDVPVTTAYKETNGWKNAHPGDHVRIERVALQHRYPALVPC